jgi:hypothetical protein
MMKEVDMMTIATGILVAASLISAVKGLYELTFMSGDDPAYERKLKYRTNGFNRNTRTRHYFLTIEGGRIIEIEPAD